MNKINLYRYEEQDGSVSVTPIKRNDNDRVHKVRLIADDEMVLTNGEFETAVVDVFIDEADSWTEVPQKETDNLIEESEGK